MNWKEKEERLNAIWHEAPKLEAQQKDAEALTLWREALALKQELGTTGAGDVGELNGLQNRIEALTLKLQTKL